MSQECEHLPTLVHISKEHSPLPAWLFKSSQKANLINHKNKGNMIGFPNPWAVSPDTHSAFACAALSKLLTESTTDGSLATAACVQQAFSWVKECSRMYTCEQQLQKSLKYNINPKIVIIYF